MKKIEVEIKNVEIAKNEELENLDILSFKHVIINNKTVHFS